MAKVIGIDLGTTNSCVAVVEGGETVVIPAADGARTTPSVVAFTKEGERLVGQMAKRQMVTNPARTISSIKREMGSDYKVTIDGKSYTPQEISAMILQKLKTDAESYLGSEVTDAVITVPAYFTDSQRQATKDAGKIAGLNVRRIINEPTAAALAYGVDKENAQKVLVFDLGGGTFDVSVLDINADVIEVLATAGNNRLGGDDFDKNIMDYLVAEFKRTEKIDLSKDMTAMSRIKEAAEKAKIELSSATNANVNLPFLAVGPDGPKHMDISITRAKFDELTHSLVDATMGPVQQALGDAGLAPKDISKVLMVGGSSRIPAVQASIKRFMGMEPFKGINPDECVAVGAALQGGVMEGNVKSLVLLDVTPLTLGVETVGDRFTPVVERNTTLPVKRSQVFSTAGNFQTSVEINVLQGEREFASANKSLGKFKLDGIRRALRGVPQIEVTFSIDANGIVDVTALDKGTGKKQNIVITGSSNMSQSEIDQAMREAAQFAAEDKKHRSREFLKNHAEQLCYQAEALMKDMNKNEKQALLEQVKKVQKAMRGKDTELTNAECETLEAMLKNADYSAPTGGSTTNDDGSADAEFTKNEEQK